MQLFVQHLPINQTTHISPPQQVIVFKYKLIYVYQYIPKDNSRTNHPLAAAPIAAVGSPIDSDVDDTVGQRHCWPRMAPMNPPLRNPIQTRPIEWQYAPKTIHTLVVSGTSANRTIRPSYPPTPARQTIPPEHQTTTPKRLPTDPRPRQQVVPWTCRYTDSIVFHQCEWPIGPEFVARGDSWGAWYTPGGGGVPSRSIAAIDARARRHLPIELHRVAVPTIGPKSTK